MTINRVYMPGFSSDPKKNVRYTVAVKDEGDSTYYPSTTHPTFRQAEVRIEELMSEYEKVGENPEFSIIVSN